MQQNKKVRDKVPEILIPLMAPHIKKVDDMLSPGLTLLSWASLNLEHFADSVTASLDGLELLTDRAIDILDIRIEGVLQEISSTLVCKLPGNEPWTVEEFVSRIKVIWTFLRTSTIEMTKPSFRMLVISMAQS